MENTESISMTTEDLEREDLEREDLEREDLEREDFVRQNETFMLNYFTRKGFVFKKEDLSKPVTLKKVLEILLAMEVK